MKARRFMRSEGYIRRGQQPCNLSMLSYAGIWLYFSRSVEGKDVSVTIFKVSGFEIHKDYLDAPAQSDVLESIRDVVRLAPLFAPETPRGQKMSVRMTAAGAFGWISNRNGYRYEPLHPQGTSWPPIPKTVLQIWQDLSGVSRLPECCLVNFYGEGARMGLHQDKDEADMTWPVLSISLGDDGLFRMGGNDRRDTTRSVWLQSGDVVVMAGPARRAYHGVDRIRFGSSSLLPKGGRLNLTLRVVR